MIDFAQFDRRPLVLAIAGPNGAGKTTFFHTHLAAAGLRFVNADLLGAELRIDAYRAARLADALRKALIDRRESFIFETVFSDPVGDKLGFLEAADQRGYAVVLCYIGLSGVDLSAERVAMRVFEGGHGVPQDKLRSRFPRSLDNLGAAIVRLPHVLIYDNSNLALPFRQVAAFEHGQLRSLQEPVPEWLRPLLP